MFAEARKITYKPDSRSNGIRLENCLLQVNACCVVLRPLERKPQIDGQPKSLISPVNSCIAGEAIVAQAESIKSDGKTTGSSTHKIQQFRLPGSCYCVIRKQLTGLHHKIAETAKT